MARRKSLLEEFVEENGTEGLNKNYVEKSIRTDGGHGASIGGIKVNDDGYRYIEPFNRNGTRGKVYIDKVLEDRGSSGSTITLDSIGKWINDANSVMKSIDSYKNANKNQYIRDYGSNYTSSVEDLLYKADDILQFLSDNRSNLSNYEDAFRSVNEYRKALQQYDIFNYSKREYFSQWDSKEEYDYWLDGYNRWQSNLSNGISGKDWALSAESAYESATSKLKSLETQRRDLDTENTAAENYDWSGFAYPGMGREEYEAEASRLDAEIEAAKKEQQDAYRDLQYAGQYRFSGYADKDDFQRRSEEGLAAFEASKQGEEKGYWENIADALSYSDTSMSGAGFSIAQRKLAEDTTYIEPDDRWTDEQRAVFGYLYATDRDEANEYALQMNNYYNRTERDAETQKYADWATDSKLKGAAATAISIASSPLHLAEYLTSIMEYNARGTITESPVVTPSVYSNAVQSAISEELNMKYGTLDEGLAIIGGKGVGDAYQLGTSILQSLASVSALGEVGSLASFFGVAAQSGLRSALDRGASPEQALMAGFTQGAAEVLFEKFSVEGLIKMGSSDTISEFIKNMLKQGGIEASEETFTSIANIITDGLVMGDKSETNIAINNYMAQGMSYADAKKKAYLDNIENVAFDALGGFISGAVSGSITTGAKTAYNHVASYNGDSSALIQTAQESDVDSLKKLAEEMSGKRMTVSRAQTLEKAIYDADIQTIANSVEGQLTSLHETGDIKTISTAVAKTTAGQELSKAEQAALSQSRYGQRMINELSPKNILSGKYRSDWTGSINTNRVNTLLYNRDRIAADAKKADSEGNYNTRTEKPIERTLKASESGKTVIAETGEDVSIQEIVSIKDGKMTLKVDNGTEVKEVSSDALEYSSDAEALVYESVANMGVNAAAANVLVNAYNPGAGISADVYTRGIAEAYRYGQYNIPVQEMNERGAFSADLTDYQRRTAYRLGQMFSGKEVAKAQSKAANRTKEKSSSTRKEGKVHFDGDAGSLSERQSASLSALEKVAEAIGTEFYFFESYVDEKTGQRVYKNADGEVVAAPNGYYDTSDGSIHIDLNAGQNGEQTILFTAAHELTHFIRAWSPAKFKVLANFLFDQYGQKGVSVEELIQNQIEKAKERGRDISYDTAYEEVVADSMETMLADGKVVEKLSLLKETDHTLWEKIKEFFSDLLEKIREAYDGMKPNSAEGQYVAEMKEALEKFQQLFTEGLVEAGENYQAASETIVNSGIEVNNETDSGSLLSVRYVLDDKKKAEVAKALTARFNVTEQEAMDWLTAETSLASLILNPKYSQYLDYEADPAENAIKQNSDYPQGTVDFSNICKKRREFTSVMNRILRLFPNHIFAATDLAKIRTIMGEEGMTLPCGICYVEDRRQLDTIVAQDFIDGLKLYREGSKTRPDGKPFNENQLNGLKLTDGDTYVPTIYELVSLEGRNSLKAKNPNMEAAWVKYNNARGMQAVRLLTNEAEYKRQILGYSKKTVQSKNDHGGLRIYSFSDAEMFHLIDIIQVITDSAAVGLSLQGYTKVNEYAKAVKDTGEKLNRSLIPKGELGYHMEDGKVVLDYDTVEGIDIYSKDFFDNRDNPDIGNITIGINDTQIRAAMVSDFVDQIIPFHTGQSEEVLGEKGIATWDNYKDFQTEKDISTGKTSKHQVNIYTEVIQAAEAEGKPIQNKRQFVEKFLEVCKENNLQPRFSQFLNTNEKGEYIYTEGYHKFLVDFKTFAQTETGEYLPQRPVKPIFYDAYITGLLKAYVKEQQETDAKVAKSMPMVIERITNEIIKDSGVKHSDRDYSYDSLVSKPDMNVTTVNDVDKTNRADVVYYALKNAAHVGHTNENGNAVVHVDDIDTDIIVPKRSLVHGLDRRIKTQAPVLMKIGEVLQNSIRVNELTPRSDDASDTYVLIGAAKSDSGLYIACFVVNRFSNEVAEIDVLYSAHAKKEPAAFLPKITDKSATPTDSTISIADLLEYVNKFFPDVLPESVLRHFGHAERPEGKIGESALYSLREVDPVQPTTDKWKRTLTTAEAKARFPSLWDVSAEESEVRNPTQISSTVKSYRKVYDFLKADGFSGTILDASSGLGYGTKAGIEEYGFDVEDIEPYPDKSYSPKYKDYSKLNKKYDVIISNAVLNVLPQDQRDALVVKMGELLNDGGRIFINVRSKDVDTLASTKTNVNISPMEWFVGSTGSYQKGFTKSELVAYLQDALGEGFTVKPISFFGASSAMVTKDSVVRFQDRSDDSVSNRTLLANALESAAKNDIERSKIQQYKEKIDLINAEEQKLHDLRAEIKELSFAKGPKDTAKIRQLQFEANQAANRINTYDRQLLRLEASTPLQNVLQREKELARRKAEQKGKEALAAYREKTAKTQRELLERYQESRRNAKEGRDKTAMRHKILDIVNELNTYLLKGTKDKHVMIGLQGAVASALDVVNMDTIGAEERIAKLNEELMKAKTPEKIREIASRIERVQAMGDKMRERLDKLKSAYADIKNSDDPLIANSHDEVIEAKIEAVMESVGDTPLRNMTLSQLQDVYDLYKMVLTTIRQSNKAFKDAKKRDIAILGNNVMQEVEAVGGKKKMQVKGLDGLKKFGWNNLKPVYAFKAIGSDTLSGVFDNVRAGEDTWAKDVSEAREFYLQQSKTHGYDSWDFTKTYGFQSSSGMDFSLNLEQIMSLYAYSKREQALDHLQRGGIVFDESTEVTVKTKLGIPVKFNPTEATAYNISPETLSEIVSKLTEEQKAFVDAMQDYLSTVMGEKGNEVSLEMYGVKLFKEKFYFPLKSATQFMAKAKEQQNGEVKIKNSGFSKETVQKASNPIVLTPFMDVWANHVNEMSMYHAFVLPMEDFYRVFNYKTPTSDKMATESVEMYIQNAYGKGATKYIEQLLKDLNGGARSDPTAGFINKMMGKFKKGAIFASLSVAIQQPSAVARAAALVDTKYFIGRKLDSKNHKALWDEVKKYAPVAVIKEMGYFDTNMGMSTRDFIKSREYNGIKDKAKALVTDSGYRDEMLSRAPALADEVSWCYIWEAVKRETQAKRPELSIGSEAFLKAAGERFTEVIVNTQVYDSVLSRSANMRSKDTGMKMATAFMAEPTTTINMIVDGLIQGKRGNRKYARAAIGAAIASQIINSILVSFVYAGRDDDEDETYLEKYLGTMVGDTIDSMNPLTYIPFIKDIISIVQGYDVERSDMAIISDLVNAAKQLESDRLSPYRKVENFAGSIAQIFGLPVKNIMRDVRGIYQTVNSFLNGQQTTKYGIGYAIKSALPKWMGGGDVSDRQQLYEAIINGDKEHMDRVMSRFDDQSAIDSAIRKALRENDPRIHDAAVSRLNGDLDEYTKIAKEIIAEGNFKQDYVVGAINNEINSINSGESSKTTSNKTLGLYSTTDFANAMVSGDSAMANAIMTEIIRTAVENGKTREDAEKNFASSAKSAIREQYMDGSLSGSKAVSALVTYCGMTQEDAGLQVQVYEWQKEVPNCDNITVSAIEDYNTYCKAAGISREIYYNAWAAYNDTEGDTDPATGDSIPYSKVKKVMPQINALPLTSAQKTALALCWWGESTVNKYKLW